MTLNRGGFSLSDIDPSWSDIFIPHIAQIDALLLALENCESTPSRADIFAAFSLPITSVKVLILGQDPYPTPGVADGLAFSAARSAIAPASLRNILTEYSSDLSLSSPSTYDLKPWLEQGVLLLNTSLSTEIGRADAHRNLGWELLISSIIEELARRDVIAILWGSSARKVGSQFKYRIESVHPSPLSAYRGFFGSRPFSRTNDLLTSLGREPVEWGVLT